MTQQPGQRHLYVCFFCLSACMAACSSNSEPGNGDASSIGGSAGGTTGLAGASGSPVDSGGTNGVAGTTGAGGQSALGGSTGVAGHTGSGSAATGGASALAGTPAAGGTSAAGGGGKTDGGAGGTTGAGGTIGAGGKSSGGSTGAAGSTGTGDGEFGFSYRNTTSTNLDWLCTLKAVGPSAYVYVRMDQTGTKSVGIATIPDYTVRLTQISVSGTATTLAQAVYDYGGGHHNDSLQLEYQGKTYRYYHSSFGFGFRPCQLMDCVSVAGGTDGCTTARALPEVCVNIKADGKHDALIDTFKKCPGSTG